MDALTGSTFQLIENPDGHVKGDTVMSFDHSSSPWIASYSGPNIIKGQVLVQNEVMLYQALNCAGELCAGRANVSFRCAGKNTPAEMILDWQWLTGDRSKGVSRWKQLE